MCLGQILWNMCARITDVIDWFWQSSFWFPLGYSWEDMPDTSQGIYRTTLKDLYFSFIMSFVLYIFQCIFDQVVVKPLAKKIGLPTIEQKDVFYNDKNKIEEGSNQTVNSEKIPGWTLKESKSLNPKKNTNNAYDVNKEVPVMTEKFGRFSEYCWRALKSTSMIIYGFVIMQNKPWFWQSCHLWHRYPDHSISMDLKIFYLLHISYAWHSLGTTILKRNQHDFWEKFIHHLVTIILLCYTCLCNLFRLTCIFLWIFSLSAVFLVIGKLFKYGNFKEMYHIFICCFTVMSIMLRLFFIPSWLLYSMRVEAIQISEMSPSFHLFSSPIFVLQILSLYWLYGALKLLYKISFYSFKETFSPWWVVHLINSYIVSSHSLLYQVFCNMFTSLSVLRFS